MRARLLRADRLGLQRLFEFLNLNRNWVLAARVLVVASKKMDFFSPHPFQPYRFEVPTRLFKFLN